MGMYDNVIVTNDHPLPEWPDEIDQEDVSFQTKDLDRLMNTYKLEDGRLYQQHIIKRDKTEKEKAEEAADNGYDSWDEYVAAYEEAKDSGDPLGHVLDDGFDPMGPSEKTVDDTVWEPRKRFKSIVFYRTLSRIANVPDDYDKDSTLVEYEARFDGEGELDEIVLIGRRHKNDASRDEAIELLNSVEPSTDG